MKKVIVLAFILTFSFYNLLGQNSNAGWLSLGVRNTFNTFSKDGSGLGAGGQFRIQLSNYVNTDWFADYITIQESDYVKSEYAHIGWSVLFYPMKSLTYPKLFQPYILAGHCFDYNKKSSIQNPNLYKDRWGSAVQAGIGTHLNMTEHFDISLTTQYMIHLTKEIEAHAAKNIVYFDKQNDTSLEGHLLITLSLNYKLTKLWGR